MSKRMYPPGGDQTGIDPALEQQIDENLRLIYRQSVEEGIPRPLQALIDQLHDQLTRREDRSEAGESPSGGKSQRVSDSRSG